ncbi:hypothetical protein SAMN05443574_1306 [Haloarcula vallismortis]|uniref:Dolichyl-phosphate-mannose-protein mannosyltransferase n=2 Tax=Haloarcula vallismortis TaxID=28442 RepID=A0A1H3AST4_HALVA|nr:hypothetical protein SAMN05443574_1306 [Haloarcula vallismortis]
MDKYKSSVNLAIIPSKIYIIIFAMTLCVSSVIFFIPKIIVPQYFGYLLLIILFIIPLFYATIGDNSLSIYLFFIGSVSTYLFLIAVDPVEYGLFGHDPYSFTLPAHQIMISNKPPIFEFINLTESWPAFYSLTTILVQITQIETIVMAKYIPLIGATIPLLFFITLRNLMTDKIAFVAALGFTSTRTLPLFEAKFIDETLAVVLFFNLILVFSIEYILVDGFQLGIQITGLLLLFTIILTHPIISLLSIMFIFIWSGSTKILALDLVPNRYKSIDQNVMSPTIMYGIIGACLFAIVAINSDLTVDSIVSLIVSAQTGSGQEVPGPTTGQTIRNLISASAIVVLLIFSAITAYGFLSSNNYQPWVNSWAIFAGIIGLIYASSLILGRLIPLDPIRLLIIFIPILIAVSIFILHESKTTYSTLFLDTITNILIISLIVTQVAAIGPHVLYSDPSGTNLQEGHYTKEQFTASEWANNYNDLQIVSYEGGLYVSRGTERVTSYQSMSSKCNNRLYSWREESGQAIPVNNNLIYTSGGVKLSLCNLHDES